MVVDASVVATALGANGPDGALVRGHLRGRELAAPDLIDVETASALRRHWLAGKLGVPRFQAALGALGQLPIERFPTQPLLGRIFELRENVTAYDASYVALAEVLDAPLLTADGRLARAPGVRCQVQLIVND